MSPKRTIKVENTEITIFNTSEGQDFFSITDMLKAKDGDFFVTDWLRNRNTLEFLGAWESLHNKNFNYGEFAIIRNQAGLNNFKISVKEWVERTSAIGIVAKTGRYGGTFAHKDIAMQFCMWISPVFQLYVIKEYERLKEIEFNQYNIEWNVRRVLAKSNYRIHTDAIDKFVIPTLTIGQKREWIYADEADVLNIALFGCTAKQWRAANPERAARNENIRDMASINELLILTNLENLNADLIKRGVEKKDRIRILSQTASEQRNLLDQVDVIKSLKKLDDKTLPAAHKQIEDKQ